MKSKKLQRPCFGWQRGEQPLCNEAAIRSLVYRLMFQPRGLIIQLAVLEVNWLNLDDLASLDEVQELLKQLLILSGMLPDIDLALFETCPDGDKILSQVERFLAVDNQISPDVSGMTCLLELAVGLEAASAVACRLGFRSLLNSIAPVMDICFKAFRTSLPGTCFRFMGGCIKLADKDAEFWPLLHSEPYNFGVGSWQFLSACSPLNRTFRSPRRTWRTASMAGQLSSLRLQGRLVYDWLDMPECMSYEEEIQIASLKCISDDEFAFIVGKFNPEATD